MVKHFLGYKVFSSINKLILKKEKNRGLMFLIIGTIVMILISMGMFVWSERISAKRKGVQPRTIKEMLGFVNKYTLKEILVGMSSSFVFGFIDNGGLFFGMDALDPFLPGGTITKAGVGNTYSDALGSILGSFIGGSIENYTGLKYAPLWAQSVGLVLGCLVGILVPRLITGRS